MPSTKVILISDQIIHINGDDVNINDIHSITVFGDCITGYAIKETPAELQKRLLDYMRTPDTKKMIDSVVDQVFGSEYTGLEYSHNFDIENLALTIQVDYEDRESIRQDFIKRIPMGISVEVNKL